MAQSLAKNLMHLIFSTKNREPLIAPQVRPALHSYLGGILRHWESPAILINSVEDHIHILFVLSKNHALKIKTKGKEFARFYWQNGYGAFSVSQSNVPAVTKYIQNQEEHHRKKSFQDEFRAFLKKHGIEYDERHVWD